MEDTELDAMKSILDALQAQDPEAQKRIIAWVIGKLSIPNAPAAAPENPKATVKGSADSQFATFADLYNAALPETTADKALVAGYWLQTCQSQEHFTGQSANKELLNLGHALTNITNAFSSLKDKRPALAIQVRKSGSSQQARKQYKLTQAGTDAVTAMMQRGGA